MIGGIKKYPEGFDPHEHFGKLPRGRSGPRGSSDFIGVSQYKRTGRWEAHIWAPSTVAHRKGRQVHLGSFPTGQAAALAYDRAAFKIRPGSNFNFPDTDYNEDPFVKDYGGLEPEEYVMELRRWAQSPQLQVEAMAEQLPEPAGSAAMVGLTAKRRNTPNRLPSPVPTAPPAAKRKRTTRQRYSYDPREAAEQTCGRLYTSMGKDIGAVMDKHEASISESLLRLAEEAELEKSDKETHIVKIDAGFNWQHPRAESAH